MISYREKQLLMVQKMLQDQTNKSIEEASSALENIINKKPIKYTIQTQSVDCFDELISIGEENGYDLNFRVNDILDETELDEINKRKKEIEREFSKNTSIVNKKDLSFLVIAIAMQCIRQYFLTTFPERLLDRDAAKQTTGHNEEHSNRSHKYYNPSLAQIIANPVPFDAIVGSNGALSGGGKLGHRATTLGHDPLLGLFFGTMNIATSTLTTTSFNSYHITTLNKKDAFKNRADMAKIIGYSKQKLMDNGLEGKTIIATSLIKEIVHLNSDINSKNSLGLPIITTFNPDLANRLASINLDFGNVVQFGRQAATAEFINQMISFSYVLFTTYNDSGNLALHQKSLDKFIQVRLRKILLTSNVISSGSNAIYVAITKDTSKLDVGGMLVTLSRLLLDTRFILKIKKEFIEEIINDDFERKLSEINQDIDENLMEAYKKALED